MFQTYQPTIPGRAFIPSFISNSDGEPSVPASAGFQVPVNLSADEIRDMVRELIG